ncbi:MAG: protein NO VEIN domain-containing protein, partial [Myxococcota bacterium]
NRLEQRMGRIHRYGQLKDCLIFNFVATNTIEGRVLQRLLDKLQEIRNALDDDAVFNVVGEVLPSSHVERVLRDYYAGKLGDADLEERLLRDVDEDRFRNICQNALEGLAAKKLNLEMLIERRAQAKERRLVPESIARFIRDAAEFVPLELKIVGSLPHTFEPARTPGVLRRYEREDDWKLPELAGRYPRCSTDRDTAEAHNLEWVTPGHPLFESIRRHTRERAREPFGEGACFHSLSHENPARIDFYRARVVDGMGITVHEGLFAVEVTADGDPQLREATALGNFTPAGAPGELPAVATLPEPVDWLQEHLLTPFLEETREERISEVERIAEHVELSLTELLQRTDEELGRAAGDVEEGKKGAEGRLAKAENRHAELLARRERRREELGRQSALSLQGVERLTSVLVMPHPERASSEVTRLRQNLETEAIAMNVVMDHERARGCRVADVSARNLGYDVTSLDTRSGEMRLIEVKGLSASTGTILLTPNERRVAEDRRDCYWLYIVTNCGEAPVLQEPILDPAQHEWNEVKKVQHYYLRVDAMT